MSSIPLIEEQNRRIKELISAIEATGWRVARNGLQADFEVPTRVTLIVVDPTQDCIAGLAKP